MIKKLILLFFILLLFVFSTILHELQPGSHRWAIKTSAENLNKEKPRDVSLKQLMELPTFSMGLKSKDYENRLIPLPVTSNLKEGDIVSTTGYLHLVALEDNKKHKDGDYHLQLTLHSDWTDSCFVVEIPFQKFVEEKNLKMLCEKNRKYVRDELLKTGEEPENPAIIIDKGIYVKVQGQLFYDANHSEGRKPKNSANHLPMHSYTAWEIHPVTYIEMLR